MEELLARFELTDIIIMLTLLIVGAEKLIKAIDGLRARFRKSYDEEHTLKEEVEDLNKFYEEKKVVDEGFAKVNARIDAIVDLVNVLVESDKERIKAHITERHHFFVQERKWIDYHSMDCLEHIFTIYKREHGNSFVEDLMNDLRQLPKMPIDQNTN